MLTAILVSCQLSWCLTISITLHIITSVVFLIISRKTLFREGEGLGEKKRIIL